MAISIDEKRLSKRQNKIREMLFPINPQIAIGVKSQSDCVKIYAKDSTHTDDTSLFKTKNEYIKGSYFEIWKRCNQKLWILQKLYFKIEMKESVDSYSEILNLHIDLDIVEDSYKKYPHIHIKHPKIECISNAHIPLNLNDFCEISSSMEKFDTNLSQILTAIEKEFIFEFKF
jgi:hypothetical protein